VTTRSTETQQFDVFLSHNSREKPAVEALAYKLRAEGLNPWFDNWRLIGGAKWQGGLAEGLRASSTCAVFIGKDDLGNWESEELDVAQNRAANDRDFRIIPVLLPSLPDPFDPSPLPPFLLSRTWVDFRPGLDDARAFNRLLCAINVSLRQKGIGTGFTWFDAILPKGHFEMTASSANHYHSSRFIGKVHQPIHTFFSNARRLAEGTR
jgi:hypothetical protein